jgi:hypothetical protein
MNIIDLLFENSRNLRDAPQGASVQGLQWRKISRASGAALLWGEVGFRF